MTSAATPTVRPGPPDTSVTSVVFSHVAADEPVTSATAGGSVDEKARHVFFSALTAVRTNRPQG
jgi:hypothetical protein